MLKAIRSLVLPVLASFLGLELFFWALGVPRAGSKFVETVIWRNHLSVHKPKDEIRVFAYGESTFVGAHYAPVSSPVRWMEAYLKDGFPGKKIRVVNFSRMGHGSEFTRYTFQETLEYKPDLAVFYMGHNDYLPGERMDQVESVTSPWSFRLAHWAYQSRLISFFYRLVLRNQIARREARDRDRMGSDDLEAPIHELHQADATPFESPFYKANLDFFKSNVLSMVQTARARKLPVLFLKPVANLKDFQPMGPDHLKPLSAEERAEWDREFLQGEAFRAEGDWRSARQAYEAAARIDDTHAMLSYRLGQLEFREGNLEKARRHFEAARDQDTIICRANRDILQFFDQLRSGSGVPVLETERFLLAEAPGGILGEPLIEDNVHFSVRGQALVGYAAAQEIVDQGWIAPRSEWQESRLRTHEEIARDFGVTADLVVRSLIQVSGYLGSRYEDRIRTARRALALAPGDLSARRNLAWSLWGGGFKDEALTIYLEIGEEHPKILETILSKDANLKAAFQALQARPSAQVLSPQTREQSVR